jgi:hypothetical protein
LTTARRFALVPLIACLMAVGCFGSDCGSEPGAVSSPELSSISSPDTSRAAPEAVIPRRPIELDLPSQGLVIRPAEGGVLVFARNVPRWDALRELGAKYGFAVVDWEERDPIVDVFVEAAPLETALARLIEPAPYTLSYRQDAADGRNRIETLEVGAERMRETPENTTEPGTESARLSDVRRHVTEARRYKPRSEAEHRAAMERRAARMVRRHEEAVKDLEDEDPEVREEAVAKLEASDARDQQRLLELALRDPDARVRAGAAKQMNFGDAPPELAEALGDTDPRVLVETLRALSWLEEPELAAVVKPFLEHPDRDVQREADSALFHLEQQGQRR